MSSDHCPRAAQRTANRAAPLILIAAVLAMAFAQLAARPAAAAARLPAAPHPQVQVLFGVVAVTEDVEITIRTQKFPVRTNFSVWMQRPAARSETAADAAVDKGELVGEFFSEQGGTLELTFPIPESLRGALILTLRVESKDGYLGSGWFINENRAYRPADGSLKPSLSFSDARRNLSVLVQARNLPPETRFTVRAGPHYTFYRDYSTLPPVTSAADGTLSFSLALPESARDAEAVMVRLDGGGLSLVGSYQNAPGGGTVSPGSLVKFEWCKLVQTLPVAALAPGEEFNAVWTVQNTSNIDWVDSEPDYVIRYAGGERMHKYADSQVIGWTVERGAVFDVAVDMIAPSDFAGWHATTWAIAKGSQELCRFKISVFVKDQ